MRKSLILVVIALLVVLIMFMIWNNVSLGNFEILGIKGIQGKNQELDQVVQNATKLATTDYQKALSDLDASAKRLISEKKNYEDLVAISTESEAENATKFETYEVEYLWTKIGNHATSEGVVIKMEIANSGTSESGIYDLKFTVTGSYVGITDFIYAVENDSSLGFKIENFKMVPNTVANQQTTTNSNNTQTQNLPVGDLQATFTCRDISINLKNTQGTSSQNTTVDTNTQKQTMEQGQTNTITENTIVENTNNTTAENTTTQ